MRIRSRDFYCIFIIALSFLINYSVIFFSLLRENCLLQRCHFVLWYTFLSCSLSYRELYIATKVGVLRTLFTTVRSCRHSPAELFGPRNRNRVNCATRNFGQLFSGVIGLSKILESRNSCN